ncbi:MAG: hypothetical protein JSW07_00290 [bacterium]|nr:MAG: hypothetical protein JSW07_00290 [bacterium]
MNGPGADSLIIRHTPETVPGGAKPGWGLPFQQLPAMRQRQELEQDYSVEGLLDQQYQQELNQIEQGVKLGQQEATFKARYQLNTLAQKYQIERREIENMRIPADKKREKLLALNAKYELAATTIRGKIQPDLDNLQMQRQQAIQQTQMRLQNKLQELTYIERNGQEWGIDPKLIEIRKLQAMGVPIPTAWGKQADPTQQLYAIFDAIGRLEEQAKEAKGEERKNILLQIEELHQQRVNIMSGMIPGFEKEIKTAGELSGATRAAGAGKRKPGTLAEGMMREKRKVLKIDTTQFRGFAPIVKSEQKEKPIEPKYQRNKTTGETRVSYDGGKTWQTIG